VATAGWYPDPGGAPGRYRYWDGQRWSAETVGDPGRGAPATPGTPSGPENRNRRRVGPWIALVTVLVVLAVVVTLVVRSGSRNTADPGPLPTSSVSAGDDTSPSPSPSPTVSASPMPTPSAPSAPPVPCPGGDPLARQDHPVDGRIHGGGLSMPAQPGWSTPGMQADGFTWAYDVGETDTNVQPKWFAAYAVGALSVIDGFEAPKVAAELAMACTTGSDFYKNVTSRRDLSSRAVTVDGHPGWTLRSEIRVSNDETTFEGDVVQITVVDVDSPESLAFFWGCAPIGDTALVGRLDAAARQVRVD
jgi:hypothetical protein